MDNKVIAALEGISLQIPGFIGYAVASAHGKVVAQTGNLADAGGGWLWRMFFGGKEEILSLFAHLQGQTLPQHWGQGDLHCLLLRPAENIVVGLFTKGMRDQLATYEDGIRIADAIARRSA